MIRCFARSCVSAALSAAFSLSAQAEVDPVRNAFGNVFPTLKEQSLNVFRDTSHTTWYTRFDLLAKADLTVGAISLPGGFDLTSIRLVTADGANVAFGTDTFGTNPFANSIEALVTANGLSPGQYAVAVSGSGNSANIFGDLADFGIRIKVLPSAGGPPVESVSSPLYRAQFGDVFPHITEQSINVLRAPTGSTWYASFDLLANANVRVGALTLPGGFDLTSIRLISDDGSHVAFGTDDYGTNPFPSTIEALVTADGLAPGRYGIEFSGSGDSVNIFGDLPDVTLRIQVAVPEPGIPALMVAGLFIAAYTVRRRTSATARSRS